MQDMRHCTCGQQSLPPSLRGRCSSWCDSFPQNRASMKMAAAATHDTTFEVKAAQAGHNTNVVPGGQYGKGLLVQFSALKDARLDAVDQRFIGATVREVRCGCTYRIGSAWKAAQSRPRLPGPTPACPTHRQGGWDSSQVDGNTVVEIL